MQSVGRYAIIVARRCDGIGRRDGLKIRWANTPCGFDPRHRHKKGSTDGIGAFLFSVRGVEKEVRRSLRTVRWTVRASEGV